MKTVGRELLSAIALAKADARASLRILRLHWQNEPVAEPT